jgi:hypothetical protein
MDIQEGLTVAAAASGTLGSVLTAISVNRTLRELNFARDCLSVTQEALARNSRDIPVFTGLSQRFEKASRLARRLLWTGVVLLALGFVLQTASALQ